MWTKLVFASNIMKYDAGEVISTLSIATLRPKIGCI